MKGCSDMTDTKHETIQNASHTPGPWTAKITPSGSAMPHKVFGAPHIDGGFYAALCTVSEEPDARLIAASPRLLKALVQVVAWAEPESGNFSTQEIEWLDEARVAIAEAKGLSA
jgi:hypothetical protein